MTETTKIRAIAIAITTAAVLATGVPVAHAATRATPSAGEVTASQSWAGIARQPVQIGMDRGWTAQGELDYPRGAQSRLPVVVLFHGSGHNDMDQTMPDGSGSTFVPVSQAITHRGYAVLRFNKRGVTGVGPVLTDDQAQLAPPKPYEQILRDAAAAVRVAARSSHVDPSRIYLLGHSEGTQVAANLAADPTAFGIPKPAGVIAMGVVGMPTKELLTYQIFGVKVARLHEQFDVNGDGYLTYTEAAGGLIGQPAADADAYRKILISGTRVSPGTDKNHDGRLAIDAEVGSVLRKSTGIDAYPNVPGVDQATRDYMVDIARFGTVGQDLPRFDGPTLLLNGENDIQTPVRAALVADAAVAAAGNPDHQIITYPGIAHTMNRTTKFTPAFGSPDKVVLDDIQRWLTAHR
jgi:uncharacterized protein